MHPFFIEVEQDTLCNRAGPVGESVAETSYRAIVSTERPCYVFDRKRNQKILEVLLSDGVLYDPAWPTPVFRDHSGVMDGGSYREEFLIGSIASFDVRDGKVGGRIRFADDDISQRVRGKVLGGHLRAVSPGYSTVEFVDVQPGKTIEVNGKTFAAPHNEMLRVTSRWYCREVSILPFGANHDAHIARAWSDPIESAKSITEPQLFTRETYDSALQLRELHGLKRR